MVLVSVFDEYGLPVSGLSVSVMKGRVTMFGFVTDADGQATFAMPSGVIVIRVSGGMYEPVEMTVNVTDDGMVIEEVEGLGDGVLDGECDGGSIFNQLDCVDENPTESETEDKESSGGFLPGAGIVLTSLALIGAGLLRRRSKDD